MEFFSKNMFRTGLVLVPAFLLATCVEMYAGGVPIRQSRGRLFTIQSEIAPVCLKAPDTLVLVAPFPVTNQYQKVTSMKCSGGSLVTLSGDRGKYISFVQHKRKIALSREFSVVVYTLKTDFSKIKPTVKPSGRYREFTGKNGEFIIPDHPEIRRTEKMLSAGSSNLLDYAKKAFRYTTSNFRYRKSNTGLHPLGEILRDRGGDCGNLSSVFISLLRAKSIPARHVVGMRPDKTCHIWAEFYLDDAGWIPADVTADLGKKSPKHFGFINDNCIVMTRDINLPVNNGREMVSLALLQTYGYWYWRTKGNDPVTIRFTFAQH